MRLALASFTLAILILTGCERESVPLPAELLKVWRTSAPSHRGKYLELRERYVIFGLDEFSISMHPIDRVESQSGGKGVVEYSIDYHDNDGEAFQIRLLYTAEPRPELQLANHKEVWKPVEGGI